MWISSRPDQLMILPQSMLRQCASAASCEEAEWMSVWDYFDESCRKPKNAAKQHTPCLERIGELVDVIVA